MGRADSMKALGREIKGSSDERSAVLSSIKKEVADDADETRRMELEKKREHREMSAQLRKDLSKARSVLSKDVSSLRMSYRNMITGIKKEHQEVVNAWRDMVATMQSKRSGARA
ncbi:MAG: hypothetical protein HY786_07240 [Deltaproteobacteria bacterium]|nr:hypothetical protein [Deltaproteobacteria bacterium]